MKVRRIDHIGIIVNDLAAARDFFVAFGLVVHGEAKMEGALLDRLLRLDEVKTSLVMMGPPDGEANIELIKFHRPADEQVPERAPVNALGIRHIAFLVEDIEAVVAKLKAMGAEPFSEVQRYEDSYKLCYVRGPEGIILDLAEEITDAQE
jgi:catechol 2,3-dioxygenase-like lactoylglutathione lyase family enzyme